MPSCHDCKYYDWDVEDSDGYILGSWCACRARNGVSNLKQFPFKNTDCAEFEEKGSKQ